MRLHLADMVATRPWPITLRRLPRLMLGYALFSFGLGMVVRAELGLSAWDVLHKAIADLSPLSLGQVTIAVSFLVLMLWIPLREKPGIGTLGNAIFIGLFLDASLLVLPETTNLLSRWALLLGGTVVVAIGSGFYIGVRLGPGPRDGLMTGLAKKGLSVRNGRLIAEGSAFLAGWALGGPVGVGTVVFTVAIGPLVQVFLPLLEVEDG